MVCGEDVQTLLALRFLDLVGPADVVDWAVAELVAGEQSMQVATLAGVLTPTAADVDEILADVASESGVAPMTEYAAGLLASAWVARRITAGDLEPISGAREIWRVARLAPTAGPELEDFVALASEWDDSPSHRHEYDADVRDAALALTRRVDSKYGGRGHHVQPRRTGNHPLPPITIDESGDLEVYPDVQTACSDLEAVDVIAGRYTAFDSRGYRLRFETRGRVVTEMWLDEGTPPDPHDLRARLQRFALVVGPERLGIVNYETVELVELLEQLLRFFQRH